MGALQKLYRQPILTEKALMPVSVSVEQISRRNAAVVLRTLS